MDRPQLYIAAGPSGGGKTTSQKDSTLENLNIDDRAAVLNGGSYVNITDRARSEAFRRVMQESLSRIDERKSFATETTLRTNWTDPIIDKAHSAGYDVRVAYIAAADPQIHVDRVRERAERFGHSAPPAVIKDIYSKSLDNLPKLVGDAGSGKINALTVLDSTPHLAPAKIQLAIEDGRVVYLAPEVSRWLTKALEQTPYNIPALAQAQQEHRRLEPALEQTSRQSEVEPFRERLQQAIPAYATVFDFRHQHPDGVMTFEHKDTHRLLHIDQAGHTVDRHGARITPEKALENALAPAVEKSNGSGKTNDPGPGISR